MKCPKCKSNNTLRFEVIYESETVISEESSKTIGIGYAGRFGAGVAHTDTEGINQSLIAQKASPPLKKNYGSALLSLLLGFLLLWFEISMMFDLLGVALMVLSTFLWRRVYFYNKEEWPDLYEDWERSWYCKKCGNIYIK